MIDENRKSIDKNGNFICFFEEMIPQGETRYFTYKDEKFILESITYSGGNNPLIDYYFNKEIN